MSDIAFASVDDFATRLGVALTDQEKMRAHSLLLASSDLIESVAGRRLSFIADDTLIRRGSTSNMIRLDGPVETISSVKYKTGQGAEITLPATDYFLWGDYLIRDGSGYWYDMNTILTVVYSHGYRTMPTLLSQIAMEAAARVWVNPGSVASEGHGGESVSYGPNAVFGLMLTDWERDRIKAHYKAASTVKSIQLS